MIHYGAQPVTILYLEDKGSRIHTETCQYNNTCHKTTWTGTLKQVKARTGKHGYTPCAVCKPFGN